MDRIERSEQRLKELLGGRVVASGKTDPEFHDILSHFIFGEVSYQGNLDVKMRQLITLVVLAVNQALPQVASHTNNSLNVGLTPVEIKEAIYQCAPFIGFPKTLNAIKEVNQVFESRGIAVPLASQSQVTEENRLEKGLAIQKQLFGNTFLKRNENVPQDVKHFQDYLSAMFFGEFFTRTGLKLEVRELLCLCIVSALGDCEDDVKAHIQANITAGNDRTTIITAITHCLPYMGFPRAFRALSCINEIMPEK